MNKLVNNDNYKFCAKCHIILSDNSLELCEDCKQEIISLIFTEDDFFIEDLILLFNFNIYTCKNYKTILPLWKRYIDFVVNYNLSKIDILKLKEDIVNALSNKTTLYIFENKFINKYLQDICNK